VRLQNEEIAGFHLEAGALGEGGWVGTGRPGEDQICAVAGTEPKAGPATLAVGTVTFLNGSSL
jgi:hypothetical protein